MDSSFPNLAEILQTLPNSTNPYSYLSIVLTDSFEPELGNDFRINIYINFILYGIQIFLASVVLILKCVQGKFWLFRTRTTPDGTLYLPNTTTLFVLWILIFLIISEIHLAYLLQAYFYRQHLTATLALQGPHWWPLYSAFVFENWGVCSSAYLQRQFQTGGLFGLPAWCLNAFYTIIFLLFPVVTLPIFALAAKRFDEIVTQGWTPLKAALVTASAGWKPGQPLNIPSDCLNYFNVAIQKTQEFEHWLTIAYWIFVGFIFISLATFLPTAWWHIKLLKAHVETSPVDLPLATEGISQEQVESQVRSRKQFGALRRTVSMLSMEVLAVTLTCLAYTLISGWVASNFDSISTDPSQLSLAYSLWFYVYGVVGIPVLGLIAYRVISPIIKPSEKDSWNVSKRSITVQLRDQTRPTLDTYNIVVTTKTVTRVEIDPTLTLDRTDYGATDRRGSNGSVTINSHSPSVHGVGDTYHLGSLGTVNELDRESSRNSVRHFNQSGIPHSL